MTPVIKDCSFKVSPGEIFIVNGDHGSGKTTLLNLIARFYNVSSGRILVNGTVDLRIVNPEWLRKVVGIIPQNPIFLNASIKENLILSLPKDQVYVESAIIEASKRVNFNTKLTLRQLPMILSKHYHMDTILL